MIRDRLVCGIRDESIQQKLLSEKGLTHERAVTLVEGVETATQNLLEINPVSGGIKREPMNIVSEREPIQWTLGASGVTCHCCGVPGHIASCHQCIKGKRGHLARVCR